MLTLIQLRPLLFGKLIALPFSTPAEMGPRATGLPGLSSSGARQSSGLAYRVVDCFAQVRGSGQ